MTMPRPAKSAACANLANLLTGHYGYDPALARVVADAAVDPSEVRRRIDAGTVITGGHGVLIVPARMWLPLLTPIYAGFDFWVMRNGGKALSGPAEPPMLDAYYESSLAQDVDRAWQPHPNHMQYPDNRAWLRAHLDRLDWAFGADFGFDAVPLTWTGLDQHQRRHSRHTVTLLTGDEVMYSARDLLVQRLRELDVGEDDITRLLSGERDALRRAVDVINAGLAEGDWADPAWLLSVPVRLRLAVPAAGGGHTVIGLADAVRADLLATKAQAIARSRARFVRSVHVAAPNLLPQAKRS